MPWTPSTYRAVNCGYYLQNKSLDWVYHFFYGFERLPISFNNGNKWKEMLPFVGHPDYELIQDGYWNHLLGKRWQKKLDSQKMYKLYLPISLSKLNHYGPQLLNILIEYGAIGAKWPLYRVSYLRPDRLLAYFTSLSILKNAAQKVLEYIPKNHFEQVPFSLKLDNHSSLSFGIDPPGAANKVISWRSEICKIASERIVAKPVKQNPEDFLECILESFIKKHNYEIY